MPGSTEARPLEIRVADGKVSGLLVAPPGARALYVIAHGAGAGMRHPFLENIAAVLAARGVASLRYQFALYQTRNGWQAAGMTRLRAAPDRTSLSSQLQASPSRRGTPNRRSRKDRSI